MIPGNKIKLREKRLSDTLEDYSWQTDPELAELDASLVLTMTYEQYRTDYATVLHYPFITSQRFAIDTLNGKHIGNCGYYGMDESKNETEMGIMIGDRDYWDKGYGTDAVKTLVNHIFRQTKFRRIHLKTLDWNVRAQRCFQKCGFTSYDHVNRDGYAFLLMGLSRKDWEKNQQYKAAISDLANRTVPER